MTQKFDQTTEKAKKHKTELYSCEPIIVTSKGMYRL